jgi:hypothetical protein
MAVSQLEGGDGRLHVVERRAGIVGWRFFAVNAACCAAMYLVARFFAVVIGS